MLAKSLLKGVPRRWEPHHDKIISSLVAVRERAAQAWQDVSLTIVRLIDNLEPENRPRAIAFIAFFPDFWPLLQQPTRTALQETVDNADAAALTEYRMLAGLSLPQFRASLLGVIADLDPNRVGDAIATQPLADLWQRAVELYEGSGSFRGSEANFRELVAPFAGRLDSQQYDQLLDAVIENGQNWDAADTDTLLLGMLRNAIAAERPTHDARNRFYQHIRHVRRLDKYEDVFAFLQADGWETPPPQQDDDG